VLGFVLERTSPIAVASRTVRENFSNRQLEIVWWSVSFADCRAFSLMCISLDLTCYTEEKSANSPKLTFAEMVPKISVGVQNRCTKLAEQGAAEAG